MASFAVKFLGCKVSQADAMLARRALLASGHTEAPEAEALLFVREGIPIFDSMASRRSLSSSCIKRAFVSMENAAKGRGRYRKR